MNAPRLNLRLLAFATFVALVAACDTGTEPDQQPLPKNAPLAPPSMEVSSAAITHTLLTAGNNTANQKIYTTASISPAPNALILVAVLGHRARTGVSEPIGATASPTVSGAGMTWTEVATTTFDAVSAPQKRMTIFRAMSAAPGSGALTITFPNNVSNAQWSVSQFQGVVTSGVNGAGAIGQIGSSRGDGVNGLAVSLAAFANSNNVAYGVFGVNSSTPAVTPGTGFTELSERASGESTPADLMTEGAFNLNTIRATWSNLNGGALGVEIKAGAAGGGEPPPPPPGGEQITVTGHGAIGTGLPNPNGGIDRLRFDFKVTNSPGDRDTVFITDSSVVRSTTVRRGYLTVNPDTAGTSVTSFTRTSANCVQFGGIGKLDTGEFFQFFIDACDNAGPPSGVGSDTFTVTLPDRPFTHGGTVTEGDIAIASTTS